MFKLSGPLVTPATLQNPTYETAYAVETKEYKTVDTIFITFRTFAATESNVNDLVSVENTAVVETWYREDITSNSRLIVNGNTYEVVGSPEDISVRHQYLVFRVRQIKGAA